MDKFMSNVPSIDGIPGIMPGIKSLVPEPIEIKIASVRNEKDTPIQECQVRNTKSYNRRISPRQPKS